MKYRMMVNHQVNQRYQLMSPRMNGPYHYWQCSKFCAPSLKSLGKYRVVRFK